MLNGSPTPRNGCHVFGLACHALIPTAPAHSGLMSVAMPCAWSGVVLVTCALGWAVGRGIFRQRSSVTDGVRRSRAEAAARAREARPRNGTDVASSPVRGNIPSPRVGQLRTPNRTRVFAASDKRAGLRELLDRAVTELSSWTEQSGVRIHVEALPDDDVSCPPWIVASALNDFLRHAVTNVAEGKEKNVWISGATHDGWIRIAIEDSGAAIPAETAFQIFSPRGLTRDGDGRGVVSLMNAKRILKAYCGRVGVLGSRAGGCLLWIELPVEANATRHAIATSFDRRSAKETRANDSSPRVAVG